MNYLQWLSTKTDTVWWHDSADPAGIEQGLAWGAKGVTTNPVLVFAAIENDKKRWATTISDLPKKIPPQEKAVRLTRIVVQAAAEKLLPVFSDTQQRLGYVCGQLDPSIACDQEAMEAMAAEFASWGPNISVKFPATEAGLRAFEEATALGASSTSTVSFTVAQVVAAAERYRRGCERALKAKIKPAPGYVVIMIGRLDDYIREIAHDNSVNISEKDIRLAGLAVVKKAYQILTERHYEAQMIVAALRGTYHMEGICGAHVVMSIHPTIQKLLVEGQILRKEGFSTPVPPDVIERLSAIKDFARAYDLEGLSEQEFATFGLTQKTLSQFNTAGWQLLQKV